jgi:hypothetical protein
MPARAVFVVVAGVVLASSLAACRTDPAVAEFERAAPDVVRVLRGNDSEAFDEMVRLVRAHLDAGAAAGTLPPRVHADLRALLVPRYLRTASDAAVLEYMRVTIAELDELRDQSFYRCYRFLYGERVPAEEQLRLEETLSDATRAAGLRAIAGLVESSGTVPVSIDEARARLVLDNAITPALPAWMGERKMVLHDAVSRDVDRVAACEVTVEAYRLAVELADPDGPLVVRYLLARQVMDGT